MLNQDAMTPLYVQLMEEVEKSIRSGEYKPGDRLMTEAEMAKKYGVSLITVRKAIGSLTEKGLVVRKQGKGTFVVRPKLFRNMKKLQSFTEMCTQMGVKPGARMLENRLIPADRKTAESLGVEAGSSVIYISRLRYADQEPVQIEKSYFPLKYAFLLEAKFDDNSLFDYLREKNRHEGDRFGKDHRAVPRYARGGGSFGCEKGRLPFICQKHGLRPGRGAGLRGRSGD